jgi:serine protease Do
MEEAASGQEGGGMNLLEQTSRTFTAIAKQAMPATVFIKAQVTPSGADQPFAAPFDPFTDDFFRRFFGHPFGQQPAQPQPQLTSGSGFVVRPEGFVATNYHVVKDATQITVILNDGREFPAIVAGTDPRTDLAVLKIEEKNLPYLTFGDSDDVEIGSWAVAIGSPFALESSLTVGVVSAKGRQDLGIAAIEDFLQTDAAINPGNSGGPLLNLQGEVIGVNTAIMTRTGGYMGIGLAIPSKMAQHVIDQIIDSGAVKRAYLGIVLQPVDKELADALGLDKAEGILVSEVMRDSPASKAGLQQGDIILSYNKKQAKNVNAFRNDIAMMEPGKEIELRVLRENRTFTLPVSLGAHNEKEALPAEVLQKLGIETDALSPELASRLGYPADMGGVVITKVKPGSPAALAGLRPSFLITGVATQWNNQKAIHNMNELNETLQELGDKKHLILIVRHQNFQRYYTLKLN